MSLLKYSSSNDNYPPDEVYGLDGENFFITPLENYIYQFNSACGFISIVDEILAGRLAEEAYLLDGQIDRMSPVLVIIDQEKIDKKREAEASP